MEEKQQVQKIFGQILYELRMTRNMKQAELAEKSDMDETYISDLERGKYMPSLLTLLKLSKGLGIDLKDFATSISSQIQ
jgi:XRE family transcriptional regulator, regulator of sulfur utilization